MLTRRASVLIIMISWSIYVLFYLCRVNYSIAFPYGLVEIELDYYVMGVIAGLFGLFYSLGQLVNGYIVTRRGPWLLLFIGASFSGLTNILFGYVDDVVWLTLLWVLNGFFQSTAWVSLIRVLTVIFEGERLGRYISFFNTSWALGGSITWIITGYVVSVMGWRYGFIINGITLLIIGSISIAILRYQTQHNIELFYKREYLTSHTIPRNIIKYWRPVLLISIAYLLAKGVLQAIIVYLPSYLYNISGLTTISSIIASIYPLSGALGMIIYGFIIDKYPNNSKVKPLLFSIPLVAAMLYIFPILIEYNIIYAGMSLATIGLLIYGINAQLVTTVPSVLIDKKVIPLSIGMINAMGYVGSFVLSTTTGYLVDLYEFDLIFPYWSLWIISITPLLLILLSRNI